MFNVAAQLRSKVGSLLYFSRDEDQESQPAAEGGATAEKESRPTKSAAEIATESFAEDADGSPSMSSRRTSATSTGSRSLASSSDHTSMNLRGSYTGPLGPTEEESGGSGEASGETSASSSSSWGHSSSVGILTTKDPAIFRRASDSAVLEGFSRVFDNGRRLSLWRDVAARASILGSPSQSDGKGGYGTLPTKSEHEESDEAFYSTEGSTEMVDSFLSHVWDAPRWMKALTLLYSTNVSAAVLSAVVTWVVSIACVIVYSDRDLVALGGEDLTAQVVYIPVLVFFLVFFFGHLRPWRTRRTVWVDKLCIHQTREDLKVAGVSAVPEFVENSKRMTILWNSTYFERLWCICEVATFCSTKDGAADIDFEPLWRAPWVLSMVLVDLICITASMRLMFLIPAACTFVQDVLQINSAPLTNLLGAVAGVGGAFGLGYVPAFVPNFILFRYKISNHDKMKDQVSNFALEATKVTVESDRSVVKDLIVRLFRKDHTESAEEVLARFDEYMRTDFLDAMTSRLGPATYISYGQSLLGVLPLIFSSASDILGCDGGPCMDSAQAVGFDEPYLYILSNVLSWTVGCMCVYPSTYPVMLRGMYCFQNSRFERLGCACVVLGAYLYLGLVEGAVMGLTTNAMTVEGWTWKVAHGVFVGAFVLWTAFLFRKL